MKLVKGDLDGKRLRVGVVASRYNEEVTSKLIEGALAGLEEHGVKTSSITLVSVPGAFELSGAALVLARTARVDAVVCLGAVIRGETPHFEYVAAAAQQGILQASLETGIPMTFGVLTTDTLEQALARAGDPRSAAGHGSGGNKGFEAARDAVEMAILYRKIR